MSKLLIHGLSPESLAFHTSVCNAKRRYPTASVAKEWANKLSTRHGNKQKPYECTVCNGWHLRTKGSK